MLMLHECSTMAVFSSHQIMFGRISFFSFRCEIFSRPEDKNCFVEIFEVLCKMEKLNRSQLPDSSSSPPLGGIFHNFDDEVMSDLPSCIYANVHHHQLNSSQIALNSLGMNASGSQSSSASSSLRMNSNNFKLHQHFLQHAGDISDAPATSTSSSSTMNTFGGPIKNSRQHGAVRERKRTMRSAPNG